MEQPPNQPPPEFPFEKRKNAPPFEQPPYQQGPYYQQPYVQPHMMAYDSTLRAKAIRGNILMYGLIGFALAIFTFIISSVLSSSPIIATSGTVINSNDYSNNGSPLTLILNMGTPIIIGFMAGLAAVNGKLATSSAQAAMHGAGAAAVTASIFAGLCGSCIIMSMLLLSDAASTQGQSTANIFDQLDVSASLIALICMGAIMVWILVYTALGALGGAVAGLIRGT